MFEEDGIVVSEGSRKGFCARKPGGMVACCNRDDFIFTPREERDE